MIQTDEDLIRLCREGDENAWETIVLKYQKLLFSIPRRIGLSKDTAADIIQEVFVTLFQKLDTLEKPEFLRAWLITTTRHKTIHLLQREKPSKFKSIDEDESDFVFEIPDQKISIEEVLIKVERDKQIETALSNIDERCKKLLNMLYLGAEQISYNEITEKLDIPLGSIGPTRARCLQKLLKFLPN